MAAKNEVINSTNKTHNTVGGASMEDNSKVMQTTSYDINNSIMRFVRAVYYFVFCCHKATR